MNENTKSKYFETGVDVLKQGIEYFRPVISNLFPGAFCDVARDPDFDGYGLVVHTDGAGSKPVQSYLHWRETNDIEIFASLAQDTLAMNLNDILCVAARPINFVDYVAINKLHVPKKEFLSAIARGFKQCFDMLRLHGIEIPFGGGETADLPDQLRTVDISGTMVGRVKLTEVITGEKIRAGDVIIGLRSGGKTSYEKQENSGLMCNGITLARHCLMKAMYAQKYPEITDPGSKGYYGRFATDEYLDELGMAVGEAIISPTRIFAPVVFKILDRHANDVTAMINNTGGGLTKCLRVGTNIQYIKDNLIEPDPIFSLIQKESGASWQEMMQDYNMGTGFEIITKKEAVDDILGIAESFKLGAQVIGRCEKGYDKNKLIIRSEFGNCEFSA